MIVGREGVRELILGVLFTVSLICEIVSHATRDITEALFYFRVEVGSENNRGILCETHLLSTE